MIVLYGHVSFCVKSIKVMSADLSLERHFYQQIYQFLLHSHLVYADDGVLWHDVEIFFHSRYNVRPVRQH